MFTCESIQLESLRTDADILFKELSPICRSITGNGVRETLSILKNIASFEIKEIPSGTVCYDWVVPDEWNIRSAFIKDSRDKTIIDFAQNNLHVVNYSEPIDKKMNFAELEGHLHYLPNLPQAIPYRTSYYKRDWGFCITYEQFKKLNQDEKYYVYIDSTLKQGSLTFGESLMHGASGKEFLISTYCCHPSLANDNLSGVILWTLLLRELQKKKVRHSYRFVIVPETIGAIAYLSQNEKVMQKIEGGFIPTTVAGPGQFGCKHTYKGDHIIDRVVRKTFQEYSIDYKPYDFDISGSDETSYSAPFFRIPVATICKDKYYEYDYYHTSLDDLNYVSAHALTETLELYFSAIEKLELDITCRSLNSYCEPMLGKRGLYPFLGGQMHQRAAGLDKERSHMEYALSNNTVAYGNELDAINWIMFYADGNSTIFEIAEKTGLPVWQIYEVAKKLEEKSLIELVGEEVSK